MTSSSGYTISYSDWKPIQSSYYSQPSTFTGDDRDLELLDASRVGPPVMYQVTDDFEDDNSGTAYTTGNEVLKQDGVHSVEDETTTQESPSIPRSEVHFAPGTAPPAPSHPSQNKKGKLKPSRKYILEESIETPEELSARLEREALATQEAEEKAKLLAAEKAAKKEKEKQAKKEALEAAKVLEAEKAAKRKEKMEKEKEEKARKAEQDKVEKQAKKEAADALKLIKAENAKLKKEKQDLERQEKQEKDEAAALAKKEKNEAVTLAKKEKADSVVASSDSPDSPQNDDAISIATSSRKDKDIKAGKNSKKETKKDKKKEKAGKGKGKGNSTVPVSTPLSLDVAQKFASKTDTTSPSDESTAPPIEDPAPMEDVPPIEDIPPTEEIVAPDEKGPPPSTKESLPPVDSSVPLPIEESATIVSEESQPPVNAENATKGDDTNEDVAAMAATSIECDSSSPTEDVVETQKEADSDETLPNTLEEPLPDVQSASVEAPPGNPAVEPPVEGSQPSVEEVKLDETPTEEVAEVGLAVGDESAPIDETMTASIPAEIVDINQLSDTLEVVEQQGQDEAEPDPMPETADVAVETVKLDYSSTSEGLPESLTAEPTIEPTEIVQVIRAEEPQPEEPTSNDEAIAGADDQSGLVVPETNSDVCFDQAAESGEVHEEHVLSTAAEDTEINAEQSSSCSEPSSTMEEVSLTKATLSDHQDSPDDSKPPSETSVAVQDIETSQDNIPSQLTEESENLESGIAQPPPSIEEDVIRSKDESDSPVTLDESPDMPEAEEETKTEAPLLNDPQVIISSDNSTVDKVLDPTPDKDFQEEAVVETQDDEGSANLIPSEKSIENPDGIVENTTDSETAGDDESDDTIVESVSLNTDKLAEINPSPGEETTAKITESVQEAQVLDEESVQNDDTIAHDSSPSQDPLEILKELETNDNAAKDDAEPVFTGEELDPVCQRDNVIEVESNDEPVDDGIVDKDTADPTIEDVITEEVTEAPASEVTAVEHNGVSLSEVVAPSSEGTDTVDDTVEKQTSSGKIAVTESIQEEATVKSQEKTVEETENESNVEVDLEPEVEIKEPHPETPQEVVELLESDHVHLAKDNSETTNVESKMAENVEPIHENPILAAGAEPEEELYQEIEVTSEDTGSPPVHDEMAEVSTEVIEDVQGKELPDPVEDHDSSEYTATPGEPCLDGESVENLASEPIVEDEEIPINDEATVKEEIEADVIASPPSDAAKHVEESTPPEQPSEVSATSQESETDDQVPGTDDSNMVDEQSGCSEKTIPSEAPIVENNDTEVVTEIDVQLEKPGEENHIATSVIEKFFEDIEPGLIADNPTNDSAETFTMQDSVSEVSEGAASENDASVVHANSESVETELPIQTPEQESLTSKENEDDTIAAALSGNGEDYGSSSKGLAVEEDISSTIELEKPDTMEQETLDIRDEDGQSAPDQDEVNKALSIVLENANDEEAITGIVATITDNPEDASIEGALEPADSSTERQDTLPARGETPDLLEDKIESDASLPVETPSDDTPSQQSLEKTGKEPQDADIEEITPAEATEAINEPLLEDNITTLHDASTSETVSEASLPLEVKIEDKSNETIVAADGIPEEIEADSSKTVAEIPALAPVAEEEVNQASEENCEAMLKESGAPTVDEDISISESTAAEAAGETVTGRDEPRIEVQSPEEKAEAEVSQEEPIVEGSKEEEIIIEESTPIEEALVKTVLQQEPTATVPLDEEPKVEESEDKDIDLQESAPIEVTDENNSTPAEKPVAVIDDKPQEQDKEPTVEQITDKPLVDEPEETASEKIEEAKSPGSPTSPRRRHRSSRHSSHRHSSSRDLPAAIPGDDRPSTQRKRRDSESGTSLKALISGLVAPSTTPPAPVKPVRVDSGIDTGSTSSHGKSRKRRSTADEKVSVEQEVPKLNSKGRTPEEQEAHDKRKAEKRASRALEKRKEEIAVASPPPPPVVAALPVPILPPTSRRLSSSRRHSSHRSYGSRDISDRTKLPEGRTESFVKTASFLASDTAMVKETQEMLPKSPPAGDLVLDTGESSILPSTSVSKPKERSDRPRLDDRERRSSRQHRLSSHTQSSRADRDPDRERTRERSERDAKVALDKVDREREARRFRREEEKKLAAARLKVEEEARLAKQKELEEEARISKQKEDERAIRHAERRRKRAEEERLKLEKDEQEKVKEQKRRDDEKRKRSTEKVVGFDVPAPSGREKRSDRERGDATRGAEKEGRRERDRGVDVVKDRGERGERVHRSSTRRTKEVEREREKEKPKGGLSSLWKTAKKAFA